MTKLWQVKIDMGINLTCYFATFLSGEKEGCLPYLGK